MKKSEKGMKKEFKIGLIVLAIVVGIVIIFSGINYMFK